MAKIMRPEEIVGMIGNISNRADIRETQSQQVQAIYDLLGETIDTTRRLVREQCAKLAELRLTEEYSPGVPTEDGLYLTGRYECATEIAKVIREEV